MSLLQRLRPGHTPSSDDSVHVGLYVANERLMATVARLHPGKRPQFSAAPSFDGTDAALGWMQWLRRHQPRGSTALLLNSKHYRILPLDAPRVPPQERKAAVRYQAQELLDFPADEASIDCIDVPAPMPGQPVSRVFVVAAMKAEVSRWMLHYRDAQMGLGSIDIPELALRNISALAGGDSAHIYLHLGFHSSRLVIVWRQELCAFRQFELSGPQLDAAPDSEIELLVERLTLEIQRTADAFARQFHGADLATLWVSSVAKAPVLVDALLSMQSLPVKALRIEDHLDWQGPAPVVDFNAGIDRTLAIGAVLRAVS